MQYVLNAILTAPVYVLVFADEGLAAFALACFEWMARRTRCKRR